MKGCLTILISWIFLPISLLFFNYLSFKTLLDYYILTSMNILLKKAPKTSKRLFDPGSIVKSPLWNGTVKLMLYLVQTNKQMFLWLEASLEIGNFPFTLILIPQKILMIQSCQKVQRSLQKFHSFY